MEVVLKDGNRMKFLKENWDYLSNGQINTILDCDVDNKIKGYALL